MYKLLLLTYILFTFNFYAQKIDITVSQEEYREERTLKIYADSSYLFSKKLLPFQSIPEIKKLNNNNIVIIYALEGVVEFYTSAGTLITKNKFYSTPINNEQKLLFEKSNNSIAFFVSENQKNRVYILNNNGDKIDSLNIEDGIASGLAYLNDRSLIAASIYNWEKNSIKPFTFIIDLNIKRINSFPLRFEKGLFSDNGKYFLGYTNKTSFLFNTIENKLLWEKETESDKIYIGAKLINGNAFFIVAKNPKLDNGKWLYPGFEVQKTKLSDKTNLIYKYNLPAKNISLNVTNKQLELNLDGKKEKLIDLE